MMIVGLIGMAGVAYVVTSNSGTSKPSTFSRGGAKVISLGKPQAPKESKSLMESIYAMARSMSGADAGQDGTDLDALHARQGAEKAGMANVGYDDMLNTVEVGLSRANEMGVATGPTAFDADIQARKDAVDPIKRLDN